MNYTLQELFNLPNIQNKIIRVVEEQHDVTRSRNLYIDSHGILRYEADEDEIKQYGENIIPITKETINFHYEIIPNYISFEDAFYAWYFNNKTIVCNINGTNASFDGEKKNNTYFYGNDIANGKWYIED